MKTTYDVQRERLYKYLLEGRRITTLGAITNFDLRIGSLTKRISDLIHDYYVPIHKERVRNSLSDGYHIEYSIIKENREVLKDIKLDCVRMIPSLIYQRGNEPRYIELEHKTIMYEDELTNAEKAI